MTSHVARLYAAAGSLLAFFLAWAGIAAHPWASSASNPTDQRSRAIGLYEQRLRADAALLRQLPTRTRGAPAPQVRIVTLPPLTLTRTS